MDVPAPSGPDAPPPPQPSSDAPRKVTFDADPPFDPTLLSDAGARVELDRIEDTAGKLGNIGIFAVTLVLFAFAGLVSWKPLDLAMLVGVLLFHELGHYLGMVVSGYSNPRIYFLPFLGAAASSRRKTGNPVHELWILILGPLPGIVAGIAICTVHGLSRQDWVLDLAKQLLVINIFNLLPISPLDGGRIMEILLFRRWPLLEAGFRVLTAGVLAWMAYALDSLYLFLPAVFSLASAFPLYKIAKAGRELAARRKDPSEADRDPMGMAREILHRTFPDHRNRKIYLTRLDVLLERASQRSLGWIGRIFYGGAYALVLAVSVVLGSMLFTWANDPTAFTRFKASMMHDVPGLPVDSLRLDTAGNQGMADLPMDAIRESLDLQEEVTPERRASIVPPARKSPEDMHLSLIVVESRTAADMVSLSLGGGTSFEDAADQRSRVPHSRRGGDMGFIHPNDLDSALAGAVIGLSKGQVAGPVQSKGRYYFLKRME